MQDSRPEISQTTPSEISLEAFLTERVDKPTEFNWKDPITRENFISWLETSFRMSMGQPMAQFVFFMWSSANLDFDYMATLKNFLQAREGEGNWDFLSEEEKNFFQSKFQSVRKHHQVVEKHDPERKEFKPEQILDAAKGQIEGLLDFRQRGDGPITPMINDLKGMSKDKFRMRIKDYVTELRGSES